MRVPSTWRWTVSACSSLVFLQLAAAPSMRAQCLGDCNGDGAVRIDELVTAVDIALANIPSPACSAFVCDSHPPFLIGCLVGAVNNALLGCGTRTVTPAGTPTATVDTVPTATVPPSRCRTSADCGAGAALCIEVGGFIGCGICYPDDVIDTAFQRCRSDSDCAPNICEPLGRESRTCSPCSGGTVSVCIEGCEADVDCATGYHCLAGRCQPPACTVGSDCPAQHACTAGGRCQRRACTADVECAGACVDHLCRAELGNCTFPPP